MSETSVAEAIAAYQSGDLVKAERLLRQELLETPDDLELRLGFGMVAASSGRRADAIERMRSVLVLDAQCLPALQYLTVLCAEVGDDDGAIEYGNRFLRLQPDNPQVLNSLGSALAHKARLSEALVCFDRAVELAPDVPMVHFSRAACLRRLSRDTEAAAELRKCVSLRPAYEPLIRLAETELALGKVADAEATCEKALALNRSDELGHVTMARILDELGKPDQATAAWERAEALEPEPGHALTLRADSAIAAGRFGNAVIDLKAALGKNPRRGSIYRTLMYAQKVGEDERPLLGQMEDLRRDQSVPDPDRLDVLYALGKAYDNLGDFEAAMTAFNEANELKHRTVLGGKPFDRSAFTAQIDRRIELFTSSAFAQAAPYASESEMPIAVVGLLRSGTTLAEQILSSHAQVGAAGEQPFWVDFEAEATSGPDRALDFSRIGRLAQNYVDVLEAVQPGFPRVVDKNPANSIVAGLIHLALPNVPIIRMQRNMVDVALSAWTTPMQTTAPFICDRGAIVYAFKEMVRLMAHWRSVIPSNTYLEVRYEELVDQPEHFTRLMIQHCRLPWDDACLQPENNQRNVKTPSFWQVRRPIYKTSKERWRKYEPWLGELAELHGLD